MRELPDLFFKDMGPLQYIRRYKPDHLFHPPPAWKNRIRER